jgi:hypothetical protein
VRWGITFPIITLIARPTTLAMSTGADVIAELEALGARRRDHRQADDKLMAEIRHAVEKARISGMSMTRVALLLGIDRTQIYRTYS